MYRKIRPTMRSSRLIIRTTAALLRGPRCTVPRSVLIPFQYACQRSFSDEKKTDEKANDDMTITFTDSATEHAETKSSTTTPTTIDRSEFTHEIPVHMPDMGEGKGRVVAWFKQEGDIVKRNDVLCDVETKDFTFGMTVDDEEDGIMGKIVVPADSDPVSYGDLLCILLHRSQGDGQKDDKDGDSQDADNKAEKEK